MLPFSNHEPIFYVTAYLFMLLCTRQVQDFENQNTDLPKHIILYYFNKYFKHKTSFETDIKQLFLYL